MRLIFITDIHDEFEALGNLIERIQADLFIIAGDILYRIFSNHKAAWRLMDLEKELSRQRGKEEQLIDLATRLVHFSQKKELRKIARAYLRVCHTVERRMMASYGRLSQILEGSSQKAVRVIPGNYDMDLRKTPLSPWNLHLDCVEVRGLKVAAYGGASVLTPGIPQHVQVVFRETVRNGNLESEPLEFLRRVRPHIVVSHQPAHGVMDSVGGRGPTGSLGMRQYLDEVQPLAFLFGHIHEKWGLTKVGRTWCLNPSNFGTVMEVTGRRKGGYFLDLGIEEDGVKWAMIRRLSGDKIIDVVHYGRRYKGIERTILDEKAFLALGGKVKPAQARGPFRALQRIKTFFLSHETSESKELMRELSSCYRALERQGLNVGFDILGSVAFGMANGGSDVDVVVYLQGLGCNENEMGVCSLPNEASEKLMSIGQRGARIEVCDVIDLDAVEKAIRDEICDDFQLQRFLFYRAVGRPVNLRIIKKVENQLLEKYKLRRKLEKLLEEYLRVLISSSRHMDSFKKYQSRIKDMGIDIPERIQRGIRAYLSS